MNKLTNILGAITFACASSAYAQSPTLTMETSSAQGAGGLSATFLAEVAASGNIANIQVSTGKTLTRSVLQVAERQTDIAGTPFILTFLMRNGIGPYADLGAERGAELAGNLRLLYPYHFNAYYLFAYESSGIDSWDDLEGKFVFNGPPRGGALTGARTIIQLTTGLIDGEGYTGKQVAWGQSGALFMDGGVDAAVRTASNPAAFMPLYVSAGRMNLISIPKEAYESEGFQRWATGPGQSLLTMPVSSFTYGDDVNVISEDETFRSVAATAGDTVHKDMSNELAKSLTAAFIANIDDLLARTNWAAGNNYGQISDELMGICAAGMSFHPGAVEAWTEAGYTVPECALPSDG